MRPIVRVIWVAVLAAPLILAQKKSSAHAEKQPGPVHVERVPPPPAGTEQAVPAPDEYPFSEALDVLQGSAAPSHGHAGPVPAARKTKASELPKDSREKGSASLPLTAKDAVAVSGRWQSTRNTPAEGKDGRAVYTDGGGLPTIVCAPLRLCIIELQMGERLTGEPQIGDSVRWSIEPASYGSGEGATTPLIVVKPKAIGLDTNLLITTDRRAYYVRLISHPRDYVAKVAFDEPEENKAKWQAELQRELHQTREAQIEKGVKTMASSVESLYTRYRIKGDESIRPVRVVDNGVKTYICMNPEILHREAPVLSVVGPDGKIEMVNYRVEGSVYIVDRLFDRARLSVGTGRQARKADIIRGSWKGRTFLAHDPFRDTSKEEQLQ